MRKLLFIVITALCCYIGYAAEPADNQTSPVIVRRTPNYCELFDRFDAAFPGIGKSYTDNAQGQLGWLESYLMQAYVEMYRATSDTKYLRKLTSRFDQVLAVRDDKRGLIDHFTSTPLAGWGAAKYNPPGVKWHVFIVHTGVITLGPAEFVNIVSGDRALQEEFGGKAESYRRAIDECVRSADQYWRNGPAVDEGYYEDPFMGLLPLNQSNALGCTLLEMHDVTKNPEYLDRARRLAVFFKRRVRQVDDHYEWAYWPDRPNQPPTSATEDISHASINVDFAVRCASRGVVFTHDDLRRFANTWPKSVRRSDGTWAGTIGGTGGSDKCMPQSAGRWLVICRELESTTSQALIDDVARAFAGKTIAMPSEALGLARLCRHHK